LRKIEAKVGVVKNADGSAMWKQGDTVAIAAVYGPKKMHPQHQQDPTKGQLRCNYTLGSFSVTERAKPGKNRRSQEIDQIIQWAIEPVLLLDEFPNDVIDVHIQIVQADAGTRCAGINAAVLALAHAGVPMKNLVSSVACGKLDKNLVVDLTKAEEDFEDGEGATDIPITMTPNGEITHIQLDGKINSKELQEVVELASDACKKIYEIQKEALKEVAE
jgi:exosome complex component RRP41